MTDNPTLEGDKFQYQGMTMAYTKHGVGKRNMLVFHGFGQHKNYWQKVAASLQKEYTVYSFDLFFHGESAWPRRDNPVQKAEVVALFVAFLAANKIERFSVAGFSLGGKFALTLCEGLSNRLDELILIAPDGLKANFWYQLATGYRWSRSLFKYFIFQPKLFFRFVNTLYNLRLADRSVLRFAANQMGTRAKRHQVYFSWCVFKDLQFDIQHLITTINKENIAVWGISGKYDKVIKTKHLQSFLRKIKNGTLVTLEAGHANLLQKVAHYFAERKPATPI